jgi:hypothetical protein
MIQTNDVALDTPLSHLEQNSAPSANSDGSSDSISTSEAKSQANGRELDKSSDYSSQEDEAIHDTLKEGIPGEISYYEERARERREKTRGVVEMAGKFLNMACLPIGLNQQKES